VVHDAAKIEGNPNHSKAHDQTCVVSIDRGVKYTSKGFATSNAVRLPDVGAAREEEV